MNGYSIWGRSLRQAGEDLGELGTRRRQWDEMVARRAEALREAEMQRRADEARAEQADREEKRRQEELKIKQAAEQRDANKPVKWEPKDMEEALEFERRKNEAKPNKPSEGEIARQQKRANALKIIPALWHQLSSMGKMPPKTASHYEMIGGKQVMVPDDPNITDVATEDKKLSESWNNRGRDLISKLQAAEVEAGYQPTKFPLDNPESSQSYRLYRPDTSDSGGGTQQQPAGSAPAEPMDEDAAAEDWLRKNPNHPAAAGVAARLRAKRGQARGF